MSLFLEQRSLRSVKSGRLFISNSQYEKQDKEQRRQGKADVIS
jgi:hypothetical protein